MKFYCHAYPNAMIEGVRFKDNFAEVTDEKDIAALMTNPAAEVVPQEDTEEVLPEGVAAVDYEEMTVAELKEMAEHLELDVPAKAKKADIIRLLEGAE